MSISIKSYSQLGEDLIVAGIAQGMRLNTFCYVDVGANSPINLNNTYLFYEAGYRGVLIEPDARYCAELQKARPGDKCLNMGVAWGQERESNLFVMTAGTLNTFSPEEVKHYATPEAIKGYGIQKVEKVDKVALIPLNEVFEKHVGGHAPDFLSIDTEGMDFPILKTIDFLRFSPRIVCVETQGGHLGNDKEEITAFMKGNGYYIFADTGLNTIFVKR